MSIRILTILLLVFVSCNKVTKKESEEKEAAINLTELQNNFSDLKNYFGEENLNIEYFGDSLKNARVTHIPTEKIKLGENKNTQIENAIDALESLKEELVAEAEISNQSNPELVEFLENPIDLKKFKFANIKDVTTRVVNGKNYHLHPDTNDSIFYRYKFSINNFGRKKNNEIVVFKYGENKHKYDDETETLIDLKIFKMFLCVNLQIILLYFSVQSSF